MQACHDQTHTICNSTSYPAIRKRGTCPQATTAPLGVLLLHGFTSHTSCVSDLLPYLEAAHIDYEMPCLRGHGGVPEDLIGVTSDMWYADALEALHKLEKRVDRIIVVGLSMGGVVTLQLSLDAACSKIIGCVTWAAALDFKHPLSPLVKPLSHIFKMWPGQESFNDMACKKKCRNYPKFPTKAFVSLYDYAKSMRPRLHEIKVPLCVIHSRRDQVIPYAISERLFETVSSPYCELVTLERSGHELGQDCEAQTVFEQTMRFIHHFYVQARDTSSNET